jgi:hypothetical protein
VDLRSDSTYVRSPNPNFYRNRDRTTWCAQQHPADRSEQTQHTQQQQQQQQEAARQATITTNVTMSASRIAIRRITAVSAPRISPTLVARPFTSLGETLTRKVLPVLRLYYASFGSCVWVFSPCPRSSIHFLQERAEENRYIRLREKAAMEARKEAARGDKQLEEAMHDIAGIIDATHDKISQEGLVNLAKWKLGRL